MTNGGDTSSERVGVRKKQASGAGPPASPPARLPSRRGGGGFKQSRASPLWSTTTRWLLLPPLPPSSLVPSLPSSSSSVRAPLGCREAGTTMVCWPAFQRVRFSACRSAPRGRKSSLIILFFDD